MSNLAVSPNFSDLLRSWRKSRKFSQGDLALEAGVSQRHLSFLESGRSSPSRDMVLQLANTLSLPLREKNALLNAAGFANMYGHHQIDEQALGQAKHALEMLLKHHEPYPAVVVDRNWNLLMMNEANARIFGHFVDPIEIWQQIGNAKPNIVRLMLHPKGMRNYLCPWHDLALFFVGNLEQELVANPYNSEARELLTEIQSYPDMPTAPDKQNGFRPYMEIDARHDDLCLKFFTVVSTFGTPQDVTLQELRLETFFPADQTTEEFLRENQAG